MSLSFTLAQLGWTPFFQRQLTLEQWETLVPARIIEQHRTHIIVMSERHADLAIPMHSKFLSVTVGDWILLDQKNNLVSMLDRQSLFSRKSAGSKVDIQLIAANVNTAFIVCALDNNFNLNRIERYLALARQADVEPVVVLTKSDCCDDVAHFFKLVRSLDAMLMVEAVNALDVSSVDQLKPWCLSGNTVAFIGSSGVGKSTLVNTLMGEQTQSTGKARLQDSRGRHTTTARSMQLLMHGGLLLDTPGMRELQLVACEDGINATFTEINELANQCQFSNCHHRNEPGCAVVASLERGELDQRRLTNYLKLQREQERNTITLAEKRQKERYFGRFYRSVQQQTKQIKGKL